MIRFESKPTEKLIQNLGFSVGFFMLSNYINIYKDASTPGAVMNAVSKSYPLLLILFLPFSLSHAAKKPPVESDPVIYRAADVYGKEFKVKLGPISGRWEENGKPKKPWSGWWYPYFQTLMFEPSQSGQEAPLQRYEEYLRNKNVPFKSVIDSERALYDSYKQFGEGWAGHCLGWAISSIRFDEPFEAFESGGVVFRVVDQKALLIKSVEAVGIREYIRSGKTNKNGNPELVPSKTGMIQIGTSFEDHTTAGEDIYAQDYLQTLLNELTIQHRPFIMDHDAGRAKWNVPVYEFMGNIKKVDESTVTVDLTVIYADPRLNPANGSQDQPSEIPDRRGPKEIRVQYQMNLFGHFESADTFSVIGSDWTQRGDTVDSYSAHPDFVLVLPKETTELISMTENKNLDMRVIDEIFANQKPVDASTLEKSSQPPATPAHQPDTRFRFRKLFKRNP